ncbi:MAG: hypothetical protein LBM71_01860, partial [Elusimicrobiota bacterium]|nr:hypothetical protein [Elusimicrobiota bacterium]
MKKEKILITVKTYPTPSSKYDELVCTAGLREDGSWVRIYPIEFRKLSYNDHYKKYDWVEVLLERRTSDFRSESFKPKSDLKVVGHIGYDNSWQERKDLVLKKAKVYTNLTELIADSKKPKYVSLAVFKPTKIIDFTFEPVDREWSKQDALSLIQGNLFEPNSDFKPVRKLPYKFKYKFIDDAGKESHLMIEDWELGALFWKYADNEVIACQKVK